MKLLNEELNEKSGIKWHTPHRIKQIKALIKNLKQIEENYQNSKEVLEKTNELEEIYNNLLQFYDTHKLGFLPKLNIHEINIKKDELNKLIKNLSHMHNQISKIDLKEYLREKYENKIYDALRIYKNHKEMIQIKMFLYNFKGTPDKELKIKIKQLYRFILKIELPLIGEVIELIQTLNKLKEKGIAKEYEQFIYQLTIACKYVLKKDNYGYSIYDSLKQQAKSLKKEDIESFKRGFNVEIMFDDSLEQHYPNLNKYGSLKKNIGLRVSKFSAMSLAKAAILIIGLLIGNETTFAQNTQNHTHHIIEQSLIQTQDNIIQKLKQDMEITYTKDTIVRGSEKTIYFIPEKAHLKSDILCTTTIATELNKNVMYEGMQALDTAYESFGELNDTVINKIEQYNFSGYDLMILIQSKNLKVYGSQRFTQESKMKAISVAKCKYSFDILEKIKNIEMNYKDYINEEKQKIINEIIEQYFNIIKENIQYIGDGSEQKYYQDIVRDLIEKGYSNYNFDSLFNKTIINDRDSLLNISMQNIPEREFSLIYGEGHLEGIKQICKVNNYNLVYVDYHFNRRNAQTMAVLKQDEGIGKTMGKFYTGYKATFDFLETIRYYLEKDKIDYERNN